MFQAAYNKQSGFTLAELLVTASVMGILMSMAVPSLGNFNQRMSLKAEKNNLVKTLQASRAQALNLNTNIAFCHLQNDVCDSMNSPITVFADTNDNQKLDIGEQRLNILHLHKSAAAKWNKSRRIRFSPTGRALNGTFTYCIMQQDQLKGFNIVISRTGRIRHNNKIDRCD